MSDKLQPFKMPEPFLMVESIEIRALSDGGDTPIFTADQVRAAYEQGRGEFQQQANKLADALMELLRDTQHAEHPSCTDGGYCPVRDAREALANYDDFLKDTTK